MIEYVIGGFLPNLDSATKPSVSSSLERGSASFVAVKKYKTGFFNFNKIKVWTIFIFFISLLLLSVILLSRKWLNGELCNNKITLPICLFGITALFKLNIIIYNYLK